MSKKIDPTGLTNITRQIRDTESTIAQARQHLARKAAPPAVLLAFESLEKRRDDLTLQFEEEANAEQLDEQKPERLRG